MIMNAIKNATSGNFGHIVLFAFVLVVVTGDLSAEILSSSLLTPVSCLLPLERTSEIRSLLEGL